MKALSTPATRPALSTLAILAAMVLTAFPASAQNLSRTQEGRVAVAQCYATCMDRSQRTALALYDRVDRLSDLLISDEYFQLTDASQDAVARLEETAICALAQDHVRGMDACHVGCVDVEFVYGLNASHARTRFLQVLNAERGALQDVGLWNGHAHSPAAGPRFDAACDRYWETGEDAQAARPASRVAAVPAALRSSRTQPERKAPRKQPKTTSARDE